ncbi:hypothetical protein B0H19DRAFT_1082835 [Mycena capillaripes]|nr:hypothetical protein B0H19DRAFT_1082835 [Mycena capillaripes]
MYTKILRTWRRLQSRPAKRYFYALFCLLFVWCLALAHAWHRESSLFPPLLIDPVAQQLGHPTFTDIRIYERNLPQHRLPTFRSRFTGADRPRSDISGFQTPLGARGGIMSFKNNHPPFPDALQNGTRHYLHVPMNALVSGPTGGGPLSSDGESDSLMRRAVSKEWWDIVCPTAEVEVVNVQDTMREMGFDGSSDGEEIMAAWARAPQNIRSNSAKNPDVRRFIGSSRVISLWPSYGDSPTLKYFAWSPLITAALIRNFEVLSPHAPPKFLAPIIHSRPSNVEFFRPYHASEKPIAGLLGIHVRRGDYEGHCVSLANGGADYNAWNLLGTPGITRPASTSPSFQSSTPHSYVWPAIPDYLNVPEGQSRRDAAFAHCWPSPEAIVARVHAVRASAAAGEFSPQQHFRKVGDLAALLQADGSDVSSSFDMALDLEQHAVSQAVDMSVLASAESFIGDGFSSLTSNCRPDATRRGAGPTDNAFLVIMAKPHLKTAAPGFGLTPPPSARMETVVIHRMRAHGERNDTLRNA